MAEFSVGEAKLSSSGLGVLSAVRREELIPACGLGGLGSIVSESSSASEDVGRGTEDVPEGVEELAVGDAKEQDDEHDGDLHLSGDKERLTTALVIPMP